MKTIRTLTLGNLGVFLAALCLVLLLEVLPAPRSMQGFQNYLPLHGALEVAAIAVSAAIFAIGVSVQKHRPSAEVRWFAWAFFAVAILDFTHTFSYAGMPELVTESGSEKAINFWLSARSFAAVVLLAVAMKLVRDRVRQPILLPAGVIAVVLLLHWIFLYHPDVVPRTFIPGEGLTPLKVKYEFALIAAYGLAALFLARDTVSRKTAPFDRIYLINAALIMALSEYLFTLYGSVTDHYNLLGHVYKVIAYLFLFRALFVEAVRQPYVQLSESQGRQAAILNALPDTLVEVGGDRIVRSIIHKGGEARVLRRVFRPGSSTFEGIGAADKPLLRDAFKRIEAGADSALTCQIVVPGEDGGQNTFALTLTRLNGLQSDVDDFLLLARNETERAENEREVQRLSSIISNSPLSIMLCDSEWRTTYVNETFCKVFGLSSEEILGTRPDFLRDGALSRGDRRDLRQTLKEGKSWQGEVRSVDKNGLERIETLYVVPLRASDGGPEGTMTFHQDITEQRFAQDQIERMMRFDQLTGLPKPNVLAERFDQALNSQHATRWMAAVLHLNLDGFGQINDALSRKTGDLVLREITQQLRTSLDQRITLAREQGDDYLLLALDLEPADVPSIVQTVMQAVRRPITIESEEIRLTCCIGVASFPDDGDSFDDLREAAEAALHNAKANGPENWSTFSPGIQQGVSRFMAVSAALNSAIRNNEFSLAYQPRMSSDGATCCGAEVLLRWHSASLGSVPPSDFIPVAERRRLIGDIGDWVLRTTMERIASWNRDGIAIPKMAINLSASQFADDGIVNRIADMAGEYGVPKRQIELELTESMLLPDPEAAIATLEKLRAAEFSVALDDFGTGYSSMQYLLQYRMQTLKIDKTLIDNVASDPRVAAVVESIVNLAHHLDMRAVAEGVETQEQQCAIERLGCDEIQGFYFCHPLSEANFLKFISETSTVCG